ncbi:uncharacterized protein LOC131848469 isoform X2 [Achroia grisella]|nr:uncharacterized protein LOC131848469 isoform X2 [Achroia grisella]
MIELMNMIISINNKELDKVTMEVNTHPTHMVTYLTEFQQRANTALTYLIEDSVELIEDMEEEEDDDDDDNNRVEDTHVTPSKRKK